MTRVASVLAIAALFVLCASGVHAESYPSRPIRLVVAQAPGGQNDAIARMLTQQLSDILKQPVFIENRGGRGGTIGADFVAKAPADGYTLLVGGSNNLAIAVAVHPALPYDPARDFVPVRGIAQVPYALTVNAKMPVASVRELVAYARAHPGQLTYGSGKGSTSGLAAELFKSMAGVDIVQVPYKGSAPAVADLVSGHVNMMFADLALVLPHAKAGTLRLLAAASEALAQTARSDELRQRLLQQGYEPIDAPATVIGAMIRSDIAKFATLVRSAGIKGEQ